MERITRDGIELEVRNYYFHRDIAKRQKGVDERLQYPHGHYGYVIAVSAVDRVTGKIHVGFSYMRPKYPFSKQEKAFFRTLALNRALSRNGYMEQFSGNSKNHVVNIFNCIVSRHLRAGFARRMVLELDPAETPNIELHPPVVVLEGV